MSATLTLTDGTTSISLIKSSGEHGFHLVSWRPNIPFYKGGGVFQESSLSWGRQLVDKQFENHIDTFELVANQVSQDLVIRELQDIRRLLEKASSYWTADWQNEPVWLAAKASEETNTRYALVVAGRIPEDENPYNQPFLQPDCSSIMNGLTLVIEHQMWSDTEPGVGTCVPIAGYVEFCPLCAVEFDGADTIISVADNAVIQDLHDAAMTVEAWIRADDWGEISLGCIAEKGWAAGVGWFFRLAQASGIQAYIQCAVTDGISSTGLDAFTPDGEWHHVAFTWDDASYDYPIIWVDGVQQTASSTTRNGAIASDVGEDLTIGNRAAINRTFDGLIGWVRISDDVRYNKTFTPPSQCVLPEIDANTVGQWIGAECSGATIDNQEGTAAIDGTLADGDFECDCDALYGNIVSGGPSHIEFNGLNSIVTVSDAASIQDLHDAAMTAEAWLRADDWGAGGGGTFSSIVLKSNAGLTVGWHLLVTSTNGLIAEIECATTDANASSGTAAFTPDSEWHHVAFTWDDASYNYPRIWIDGVEQTNSTTTRNGAVVSDVGNDLYIGNRAGSGSAVDGDIGWVRVSDSIRYTGTFTPPARCTIPTPDANTIVLEVYEGVGDITYDLSGNGNDGAIALATWGHDCLATGEAVGDIDYTCTDKVYIANKHNMASITHIFVDDGGTFSPNFAGSANHILFPATPAVDDAVYFGIDTTTPNSGPFSNLTFSIFIAQEDITDVDWEYWDGAAWAAMTVLYDATIPSGGDTFQNTGENAVTWLIETDWATKAVNGVTGYWVRARVNTIGAAPTWAVQGGSYPIYTCTWPFIETESDQVVGDVAALARILYTSESNQLSSTAGEVATRIGLRSLERGENFSAYLNASDEQNNSGVTFTATTFASIGNAVASPTGRVAFLVPPGLGLGSSIVKWTLSSSLSQEYYGQYHAYIRVEQTAGTSGDLQFRLPTTSELSNDYAGKWVTLGGQFGALTGWIETLDMGKYVLPNMAISSTEEYEIVIRLDCRSLDGGTATATLFDLILIPTDEFSGTFKQDSLYFDEDQYLDVDSILYPKTPVRAHLRDISNDEYLLRLITATNNRAILQSNAQQRLWFLTSALIRLSPEGIFCRLFSGNLYDKQRYLSMRGDR